MSRTHRCPICNSARVIHELSSSVRMRRAGAFDFEERTYDRCVTCGHTWNRRATRSNQPIPTPGFWTRLIHRLFPFAT